MLSGQILLGQTPVNVGAPYFWGTPLKNVVGSEIVATTNSCEMLSNVVWTHPPHYTLNVSQVAERESRGKENEINEGIKKEVPVEGGGNNRCVAYLLKLNFPI